MTAAALIALAPLLSCQSKADADAVAASCGGTCPAGTYRDEVRESRAAGVASADFVEGSCAWSCVAVATCPDGTVPVITADCFTCARAMPGGPSGQALIVRGAAQARAGNWKALGGIAERVGGDYPIRVMKMLRLGGEAEAAAQLEAMLRTR